MVHRGLDETAWTELQAAWPGVEVSRADFEAHVAKLGDGSPAGLFLDDLYLALACAAGQDRALAAFRDRYGPVVRHAAGKAAPGSLVDEVVQRVLTKLFVGDGDRAPGISRYGGRGRLSTWIQVVTRREASNLVRAERARKPSERDESELLMRHAVLADDPALAAVKASFRATFKKAFAEALEALSPRDRNLLRYECIDRLSREQIAGLCGVSTSTVARWRSACRARLNELIRARFAAQIGGADDELKSAMGLIDSQLEVSLSRLLAPQSDDERR